MLSSAILLGVYYEYLRCIRAFRFRNRLDFTVQQHARPAASHGHGFGVGLPPPEPLPPPERLTSQGTELEANPNALAPDRKEEEAEREAQVERDGEMESGNQYL